MTDKPKASASTDIARAAQAFMQWRILDPTDIGNPADVVVDVRKGKSYLLHNQTNHHFLQYKTQGPGTINLGFSDDAAPSTARKVVHWQFLNRDGSPVRYDEPVAIRCKDDYLYYGARPAGINLDWGGPNFQWRLYGGKPGTRVQTRDYICIWNMHGERGEPMIYFKREYGGNIGWPSSKTLVQQGLDWVKETVQEAIVEYFKTQAGGK